MDMKRCRNPNHPKKGSFIKVEPIRSTRKIQRIKKILYDNPRNYCLFVLGINSAYRASDLLSIRVRNVKHLQPNGELELKEKKTQKNRRVNLNKACIEAIQRLLKSRPYNDDDYLFLGQRGRLTVSTLSFLVKSWCREENLPGNYASHTLRKTWGYHQRATFKTPLPILMEAFRHSPQRQTLDYLCVNSEEIKSIYQNEI
mgnify:CR=1 FL=1|jgi:integrase